MRRWSYGLGWLGVVVALAGGLWATGAEVGARTSSERPAQGATVLINEVQYDPVVTGSETASEWIELYNPGASAVRLAGWQLADGESSDALPDVEIPPGGFFVVAAGDGFTSLFPGFGGAVVFLGGSIGNGLGNGGDQVRLLDGGGQVVDAMSYGDDTAALDPAPPDVDAGHSLERVPAGRDTDSAGDWLDQPSPSPGASAGDVRPTDTPAAAPPPTVPAGAVVVLNEHLPAPRAVDWDGDGQATRDDEWVELFNPGDAALDLRGWQLDDVADGGSSPFVIPAGSVIQPRGHLVFFKRDSGLALNNDADSVRLLRPDGTLADVHDFTNPKPDASFARPGDGAPGWTDTLAPSPGGPNGQAVATPGGTASTPGTPGATPPGPATPGTPGETPRGPATPGTPGTPAGPPELYLPLLISEILFDPEVAGNDAAAEWVEIHNRGPVPVDLAGWSLGDRAGWDGLSPASVPAGGFVVVAASAAAGMPADVATVYIPDGAIGNGLANGGDVVRLRGPTGGEADAVGYGGNLDAFDPAVPTGPPGSSIERLPPEADTDSAADWWVQPAPSPGRAGTRHDGPPPVAINEVLPAPARVDWDGDGTPGHVDEWVELYNPAEYAVDLDGWRLEDRAADGWSYTLPPGARIAPKAFRVVYRAASGLALDNHTDTVRLIRPDGATADRFTWMAGAGYDRSWSRAVDGTGEWVIDYPPSPGGPNRPPAPRADAGSPRRPEPARAAAPAELRALDAGTRVRVAGRVTAPPGLLGARTMYVGDETAGVMVFLEPKDEALPELALGDRVTVLGRLKDYHGEREVVVARAGDVTAEGAGPPVPATTIPTGALGEATEGRLVHVRGRVVTGGGPALTVDDGSGPARVVWLRSTGLRRPFVPAGAWFEATGIAGQSAQRAPWEGGYRILPRIAGDIGPTRPSNAGAGESRRLPRRLPETGAGGGSRASTPAALPRHLRTIVWIALIAGAIALTNRAALE